MWPRIHPSFKHAGGGASANGEGVLCSGRRDVLDLGGNAALQEARVPGPGETGSEQIPWARGLRIKGGCWSAGGRLRLRQVNKRGVPGAGTPQ